METVVPERASRVSEYVTGAFLLFVLVVNVPAFVCMGLDPDVYQWDLDTRTVLEGRILYQDCAENNLPGMLVPLAVIRSVFGWRSEVLRLADLLIVIGTSWQLCRWLPSSATRAQRLGLVGLLLAFYLSTSEWCHCQRDVWMMVPALAALSLRRQQVDRLTRPVSSSMTIGSAAFAEGLLWAMAFWIKPFIAVPALACWLLSARMAWSGSRRIVLVDGAAILAGGVTAGAAGIVWLIATGAWPAFVEVMFVWNREYVVHDVTQGQYALCVAGLAYRFFPWILVHLVAVPVAFGAIRRGDVTQTLLAGMYLGWLVQSVCLQHLFDYVHTPPVLLGLTVAASWCVSLDRLPTRRMVAVLFLLAVFVRFPALCLDRVTVWGDCLRQGSTATLRDRLTLLPKTNWADLARVKDFLREQEIQHGELSCMDMPTISLYTELGVRPATRFHFLHNFVAALPRQRGVIYAELAASDQRFMLCDSESPSRERLSEDMTERVVFRAGRYVVMRLSGPETPEWIEAQFRNIHR